MEQQNKYRVVVSARAAQTLVSHAAFLAQVSPAAAERLTVEFEKAAKSLEQMPQRCPWLKGEYIPKNAYRFILFEKRYMMMQSEGVAEFKDGEPWITENETLHRVCETIVDMGKRKACYLANSWSDYIDQSIQGDMVAGVLNGNWIIPTMEAVTENSGKWEITTIPTLDGGEGYASNGGCGLYITANCGNVDLAKSFLAYTFGGSTQTYDNALRDGGVVTTVLKCADSDVYNEGVEFFNNEPIYKQIVEMGSHVPVIEQSDYHFRAGVYLITAIINTVNGSNLDDELANAEQQLRFEMGL